MKYFIYFVIACFFIALSQDGWSQSIPPERSTDWSHAGYDGTIPVYPAVQNITDYGGLGDGLTPNDAALHNAITALSNQNGIIYFPAGIFVFNQRIFLRSGLILKGEGAAYTTLQCNLAGAYELVIIAGSASTIGASLVAPVFKDGLSIEVDDASPFQINDYIKIYQEDAALVNDDWALGSVGQILHIENISGNTIFFSNALRRNYLIADLPRIKKLNMVSGAGIECLKIKRLDENTASARANIYIAYAANCWIHGVESDSANFAHVQVGNSTHIEIKNSFFHGAFDYGAGKGYGIDCENTSGDCLIENNVFKHLRHSMLIQAGVNGNVFDYNYSIEPHKSEAIPVDLSGDIVMHGNYPYLNLFEGNIVQNILIDQSHGINGPYNTVFRNRAELYGIIISAVAGDSSNIVGNEITNTSFGKGNYTMQGDGNLEYGNNKNNTIIPPGTTSLADNSYLFIATPGLWNIADTWPSIGIPNTLHAGSIPAEQRYNTGQASSFCQASSPLIYRFTGDGNWSIISNWSNGAIPPLSLPAGSEIIIEPAGECFLDIPYTVNPGVILTVEAGKHFIIQGNLSIIE